MGPNSSFRPDSIYRLLCHPMSLQFRYSELILQLFLRFSHLLLIFPQLRVTKSPFSSLNSASRRITLEVEVLDNV